MGYLTTAYEQIILDIDGPTATITLDRPEKLNAFSHRMVEELCDAFDHTDADPDVRVVIVTGSGRAFCSGADLAEGGDTFRPGNERVEDHRDGGGLTTLRIFESLKPVIAAINGPAVGVGVTMTLPMDVRMASETARFGFVFTRRGLVPEAASSWFLPRVVGVNTALEWVYTGRMVDAAEAAARGLVRSVHPPEELLPAARALATEIADHAAPVSATLTRHLLWRMLGAAHPMEAHRRDSALLYYRGAGDDVREGVAAWTEKRPAAFPERVPADLPPSFPWWDGPEWKKP